MSVQQDIDLFFEWIQEQKKEIDKLPERFRRILLLSLLDLLSRCAFPKEKNNRKRFVDLIDCNSEWKHKDHISLPQLRYRLLNTKAEECQELINEVERRMNLWPYGRILRPEEADPLLSDLDRFKQGECEKLIELTRYASLLWTMRNFVVHEFRTPGQGWEISKDNSTPYYHGQLNEESKHSWELYIPSEVISKIVLSCSDNLKKEFKQNLINPYDSFDFGSSWFSNE
jgi:hypothetical protein